MTEKSIADKQMIGRIYEKIRSVYFSESELTRIIECEYESLAWFEACYQDALKMCLEKSVKSLDAYIKRMQEEKNE